MSKDFTEPMGMPWPNVRTGTFMNFRQKFYYQSERAVCPKDVRLARIIMHFISQICFSDTQE